MDRKIIYLIVIVLTIVLVVSDHYASKNKEQLSAPTDADSVHEISDDEFEEIYRSSAILAPLTLRNYQNDDKNIVYTYEIKINEVQGAYYYIQYDKDNNQVKDGYLIFAANGEVTVKLNSNEKIVIENLPTDVNFRIEQYATLGDKYTTKVGNKEVAYDEGTMRLDNNISFSNETVRKETVNIYEKKENNPTTADNHEKHILYFMIALSLLLSISSIKVKRFE